MQGPVPTPVADFCAAYRDRAPVRLHMPGHKGRPALGPEPLDMTEVPGADVLSRPEGILRESMDRARDLFGSAATFYSAEGSSLSIRAMVYLALRWARQNGRPPVIAAGRNAHLSFVSAAALLRAQVVWLWPRRAEGLTACPLDPGQVEEVLRTERPAALWITSPDYLGNLADVAALAALCRTYGVLLLVDNAHGAYLRFLPEGSLHPLDLGADLCCDSAHKTLPTLTGGAYLHVGRQAPDPLAREGGRAMALFASTSPSYLILQSLDLTNRWLAAEGREAIARTAAAARAARTALTAAGWALTGQEPLKLTLAPRSRGWTGAELAAAMEGAGFVPEYADPDSVVCMLAPETDPADLAGLTAWLNALPVRPPLPGGPPAADPPEEAAPPWEAMLAPRVTLPLDRCLGRVLADPRVSCPPAVPPAVWGERLNESALAVMRYYGIEACTVTAE